MSILIRKEGKNRVLHVANAGDSRATLSVKGKGERLSYDHKASDADEKARVEGQGATILWDKVQGTLSVTRALGDHDLKSYGVCADPHYRSVVLDKQHKFLVVACDGIWCVCRTVARAQNSHRKRRDVASDDDAVQVVEKAGKDAMAKAKRIIEYSKEQKSGDNLTAAVIML